MDSFEMGDRALYRGRVMRIVGEARQFGGGGGYYELETMGGKKAGKPDFSDVYPLPPEGYLILWHEELVLGHPGYKHRARCGCGIRMSHNAPGGNLCCTECGERMGQPEPLGYLCLEDS
jgi:hypothetical protein